MVDNNFSNSCKTDGVIGSLENYCKSRFIKYYIPTAYFTYTSDLGGRGEGPHTNVIIVIWDNDKDNYI